MKGIYLYFAFACLLGALLPLTGSPLVFGAVVLYLFSLKRFKKIPDFPLILIISFIMISTYLVHCSIVENVTVLNGRETQFIINFSGDVTIDGDLLYAIAEVNGLEEKVAVRYKIKSKKEKEQLEEKSISNMICESEGELKYPSQAKNPDSFDYRSYLFRKHIFWVAELNRFSTSNCTYKKSSIISKLKQLRNSGINHLEKSLPTNAASLSSALIFGDTKGFQPGTLPAYQKIGITHLLAISGMQVTLISAFIFFLGIRIGFTREFMTKTLLGLLPVYAVLTGCTPSVVRAVLMAMVLLVAHSLKSAHSFLPINALSVSFVIFVWYDPFILYDAGFQLSYIVTAALLFSSPVILSVYERPWQILLSASYISQMAALPILLYHFYGIPMIGLFANLLFIPLYSFIFVPGVYLLFILSLIFIGKDVPLSGLVDKMVQLSDKLALFLSDFPLVLNPGKTGLPILSFYLFAVLIMFVSWEKAKNIKKIIIPMLLPVIILFLHTVYSGISPEGYVTMLDVGQGDSIFIKLPNGKGNYLIDTGGIIEFEQQAWQERNDPFEPGKDVVVPFLKAKGITVLDKLILTHGDMDHIGGAISIINEIDVHEIVVPDIQISSEIERKIFTLAEEKEIPISTVSEGVSWASGASMFTILSPKKGFSGERNSGSIVIYAKMGGLGWFFGGDLEEEGELRIAKSYPTLQVDVLKAGHHGSKTSSSFDFLKQYNPETVWISAGENNRYGHPHQEVLIKIKGIGAEIYRTDKQGAITYRFHGEDGTFSTVLP